MSASAQFDQPTLISGVTWTRSARTLNFKLNEFSVALDLDTDTLAEAADAAVAEMAKGTVKAADLASHFNSRLSPYSLSDLISLLAQQNILRDAKPGPTLNKGTSLYYELQAYMASELAPKFADEEGALKLHNGSVSKEELKAWSIQYYFTTRFAEQCVIGALNHHSNDQLRQLLEEFFIGEVGHDKLLERSLIGFGYSEEAIQELSPHISTVAVMGMLLRSSIFDIPFFIALLGQMEGTEAKSRRYIALLKQSGLPEAAIAPQITHEMINIEHDHFGEALQMSGVLDGVSQQDIDRCKQMLALYFEMRAPVYEHVFPDTHSARYIAPSDYRAAWSTYQRQICRAVLPIAAANAPERLARKLSRDFVELHKVQVAQWSTKEKTQVAAAILEFSLWKLAYQEPARLPAVLAWLDLAAAGNAGDSNEVPSYFVAAMTDVGVAA